MEKLWMKDGKLVMCDDGRIAYQDECPCDESSSSPAQINYAVLIAAGGNDGDAPYHPDGYYSVHDVTIEVPCLSFVKVMDNPFGITEGNVFDYTVDIESPHVLRVRFKNGGGAAPNTFYFAIPLFVWATMPCDRGDATVAEHSGDPTAFATSLRPFDYDTYVPGKPEADYDFGYI